MPVLTATTAHAVAREVVDRIAHRPTLDAAIDATARQTTVLAFERWRPHSVAGGYAGTALLLGAADVHWPEEGFDRVAHEHLSEAVAAMESLPRVDASMFTGLSGIGLTALAMSAGRDRYRGLLASVDEVLVGEVDRVLDRQSAALRNGSVSSFDLISGLTGIGAYLLCRHGQPGVERTLRRLLEALARMLTGEQPQGCFTPVEFLTPTMRHAFPQGNMNCGLAHGVPGPLSLLALAVLDGVVVDGARLALSDAGHWLAAQRLELDAGPDWPNAVAPAEPASQTAIRPTQARPGRAAWCYGSPGVARSLWLAGQALDDAELRELALRTMRAVAARRIEELMVQTPTFCHGYAGLLQLVATFARDTAEPELVAAHARIAQELVEQHEPTSILGFREIEASGMAVDQPTLLSGAAGVALALSDTGAAQGTNPSWERVFLLS